MAELIPEIKQKVIELLDSNHSPLEDSLDKLVKDYTLPDGSVDEFNLSERMKTERLRNGGMTEAITTGLRAKGDKFLSDIAEGGAGELNHDRMARKISKGIKELIEANDRKQEIINKTEQKVHEIIKQSAQMNADMDAAEQRKAK